MSPSASALRVAVCSKSHARYFWPSTRSAVFGFTVFQDLREELLRSVPVKTKESSNWCATDGARSSSAFSQCRRLRVSAYGHRVTALRTRDGKRCQQLRRDDLQGHWRIIMEMVSTHARRRSSTGVSIAFSIELAGQIVVAQRPAGSPTQESWPTWGGPRRDFVVAASGLASSWRNGGGRALDRLGRQRSDRVQAE